jgi:hypothetical protein
MIWSAFSSNPRRTDASGQGVPRMCSLSASPVPTPQAELAAQLGGAGGGDLGDHGGMSAHAGTGHRRFDGQRDGL